MVYNGEKEAQMQPITEIGRGSAPRSIAITGGKGGVGKSTIATNLAVFWGALGKTLLVDGDLGMADLNLLLGLAPQFSALNVVQGRPVEEVLIAAHGIHLLPALNGSYQLANLDSQGRDGLFGAIDSLASRFDTLVVDAPAGISENAVAFAGSTADVVVIATPEPLSLADAYANLKVLATRRGITRAYLLPNAVRSPAEADEVVERLKALVDRFLGIELVPLPPIPYDAAVPVAAAAGKPLMVHNPESPAARAIARAARRISALQQPGQRQTGLWLPPST